jgi:competence protein ComEA
MKLSDDERRALAVILGLLLLASLGRWVERPRTLALLADAPSLDIAALEEESRALKPPPRGAAPAGPIDLNAASARELEQLPGVGPAVAARIVEARTAAGPFTSLPDLATRVRGVGPAMLAKWDGKVVPFPPTPESESASASASAPPRTSTSPSTSASASASARASEIGSGSTRSSGSAVAAMDLNQATPTDLEKISGVGPILAGRLVARRDSLGRFREWSEVDAVPGVGPAMLARLKGLAVLGQ